MGKRRKYSAEFKQEAVAFVNDQGKVSHRDHVNMTRP